MIDKNVLIDGRKRHNNPDMAFIDCKQASDFIPIDRCVPGDVALHILDSFYKEA